MSDGDFEHRVRRHGEEAWFFAGGFDEEREDVEGGARGWRGPTGFDEARGEVGLGGIPQHGAVGRAVTGVADELVIVDARARRAKARGGEDGDERLDASAIGRAAEVGDAGFENTFGGGDFACVDHFERFPKASTDAAAVVAPGEAAGEREFGGCLVVEAVAADFFDHFAAAGGIRVGAVFLRELIEERVCGLDRIGGVAGFVGQQRGVVGREVPTAERTLRGDVHSIRGGGWKVAGSGRRRG